MANSGVFYTTSDRLLQSVDGGSHLRVGAICIYRFQQPLLETASQSALQQQLHCK